MIRIKNMRIFINCIEKSEIRYSFETKEYELYINQNDKVPCILREAMSVLKKRKTTDVCILSQVDVRDRDKIHLRII